MEKENRISFIVPAYNVEMYILKCLNSLIPFIQEEHELIIINDGSTDNTLNIIHEFKCKFPEVIVIDQENKGLSGARNSGLHYATGEYVWFIDSDDYIDSEKSLMVLDNIKDNYDSIVFGRIEHYDKYSITQPNLKQCKFDSGLLYLEKSISDGTYRTNVWDKLYRLEIIKKHNIQFVEGLLYEDMLFNLEYFIIAHRIAVIPEYPYNYIKSNSSSITTKINIKDLDVLKFVDMTELVLSKHHCEFLKDTRAYNELIFNWVSSCLLNKYALLSLYEKDAKYIFSEVSNNSIYINAAKYCASKKVRRRLKIFAALFLWDTNLYRLALIGALKFNKLKQRYL